MSSAEGQLKIGPGGSAQEGERVVFDTRLHWITAGICLIFLALFAVVRFLIDEAFGLSPEETRGAITVALIGVPMAAGRVGMILYSRFSVTTERITFRDVALGLATQEIFLSQIERVDLIQGALGFLLGYGHLRILLHTGDLQYFYWISQPIEFREHILNALAADRDAA